MSKKYDFNLDVISNIDEDIVDKHLKKRFELWRKKGRPRIKYIPIIAAAACFFLIASVLLVLLPGLDKQIPVYTGMTVSSSYTEIEHSDMTNIQGTHSLSLVYLTDGNNGNHNGHVNKPIKEAVDDELMDHTDKAAPESSLKPCDNSQLYYAGPNEDIYITIHFDNPDDFEILSFTFNGKKYTSYMFEEGSDMENIIIKQNTGNTAGLLHYTIDAIKYVDGTEIKDVTMTGNQTVSVGVYSQELQPTAVISNVVPGYNDISFNVSISDNFNLLGYSQGKLYAMLYNGENIVDSKELTLGKENTVKFEELITGHSYQCAIVGVYDAYDKQGTTNHIIYTEDVATKTILSFTDINVSSKSISFSLLWDEGFENKVVTSLSLYKEGEKICDISPEHPSVDGLLAGCEYTIVAEYLHRDTTEKTEYKVTTITKATPTVNVTGTGRLTSVDFEINVTDADNTGSLSKIELIRDDGNITVATSNDIRSFTELEKLRTYTVKVTFIYDLEDGNGPITLVDSFDFVTQSEGLNISEFADGSKVIMSMGTCTDTELYINMPLEGSAIFSDNENITAVHFGPLVTEIPSLTFLNCINLSNVTFAEGLKIIGETAFSQCYELTTIVIPQSVTEIGAYAFNNCKKLEIINIPDGITVINEWAFANCNLQVIAIPQSVTTINEAAFGGNAITSITIPDSVTYIGRIAFANCDSLNGITIPNSVTYLGEGAFEGCFNLTTASLPNSIITIAPRTFYDCGLETIVIPEGITTIESEAFYSCDQMESITLPASLTAASEDAFTDCGGIYSDDLDVHISDLNAWLNSEIIIVPRANVKLYLNNVHLTEIVVPSTVSKIHDYAFYNCTDITSITIPEGVTSIGTYAFYNCNSLTNITVPTSVNSIGAYSFANCELLESVTILGEISLIEEYVFNNCQSLIEVRLPKGITRIRANAFTDCPNLTMIYFDGSITDWSNIILVVNWKSKAITVKCSDGDISV